MGDLLYITDRKVNIDQIESFQKIHRFVLQTALYNNRLPNNDNLDIEHVIINLVDRNNRSQWKSIADNFSKTIPKENIAVMEDSVEFLDAAKKEGYAGFGWQQLSTYLQEIYR